MAITYALDVDAAAIARSFGAAAGTDPWEGGVVSPGQFAPVVIASGKTAERRIVPRFYGLPAPPKLMLNGGGQSVTAVRNLASPFWIGSLRHTEYRCLVPATRFLCGAGARRSWASMPGEPVFALAGLWQDSEVPGFALISTTANEDIAARGGTAMPLVLERHDHDHWLRADWKVAQTLVEPIAAHMLMLEPSVAAGATGL